eukprot:306915_1
MSACMLRCHRVTRITDIARTLCTTVSMMPSSIHHDQERAKPNININAMNKENTGNVITRKKQCKHKHNIGNYVRAIANCGPNQTRALKIFETMRDWNLSPDLHTFNALVNVAHKANNLSLCWDLFNKMRFEYEIYPNHETYLILFGAMLTQKQYNDILQEFDEIALNEENDYLLFTIYQILPTAIISCGKLGKIETAKHLFSKWFYRYTTSLDTDKLSQSVHNAMINAIISVLATHTQSIADAIQLLQDIRRINDCVYRYTDDRAYISLLNSNCAIETKQMIYRMALETGSISTNTFNRMLTISNQHKQWAQSLRMWRDIHNYDAVSYILYMQCLVYSFQLRDIPKVIDLILNHKQTKLNRNALLAQCMIWSTIEALRHNIDCDHNPMDLFLICKYEWNVLPTTSMYNELLWFSMKFLNYKQALNILDEMKQCNVKLDTKTFNIFISGMGKLHRMDLIQELLLEMEESQCPMNGATYMNLLDAAAQHGAIDMCTHYLSEFKRKCASNESLYVDKNCYSHVINCYANHFANADMDLNGNALLIMECFNHWQSLKQYQSKPDSADYILMLKCLKNYCFQCSSQDHALQIKAFVTDVCENRLMHDATVSPRNVRTAFNLALDILYGINEIELGLHYYAQALSINVYSCRKSTVKQECIDIHKMTRYPALFAVLHYLRSLQAQIDSEECNKQLQIITGVGMTSIDWKPILKPMICDLLDHGLTHSSISHHVPSYNEGVIMLDAQSLQNRFKNDTQPITLTQNHLIHKP